MDQDTSIYDLLQKATQARCALGINSCSSSASVKRFSAAECTLPEKDRPTHLSISNRFIDAAVAKWEPVFKSTTVSPEDVNFVLTCLKDYYGLENPVWRLSSETSEDSTHRRHANDLELIRKIISQLINNSVNAQKVGIFRLVVAQEQDVAGVWSVVPDFRGLLIFDEITRLLHPKNIETIPMTLVTMEDKTMTVAQDMFKETQTIPIVWPDAYGTLPDHLTKERKKTLAGAIQVDLSSVRYHLPHSSYFPGQIVCQMDRYRTNCAVFYTMNRVLYLKRAGTELVRSQPPDTQGFAIDFVQYASWIMEAAAEHLANYDTWYRTEVLNCPSDKTSTTQSSKTVHPTVKFALLPSVPLPSWLFDKALALAPFTRIKLGNNSGGSEFILIWASWHHVYPLPKMVAGDSETTSASRGDPMLPKSDLSGRSQGGGFRSGL
ncbi:hypothetical protein VKT23_014043 [Stygiomarasmius scandens]|uniref:Uncharacterized protein n=1 Tax=Marasmiellus scandens TaxID=2682957 RepID=A0ABR1J333_9AGAR